MPNYGLVINSRFRPFSYQEMLAPVAQATQAHQALEEAYGALGVQAGTVESMLNRELDRDAYNQYQGYMQGLKESADVLATQGLSPSLRGSLNNLRTRYSQEIIPIQKAAERREKLAEEQRKLGNSMIFDIDAANTGLSYFIDNPSLNYRSIDRKDLYTRAMNDFGQLANDLASYGKGQPIDKFTNTFIKDYGITRQQATDFANAIRSGNIDAANPVLRAIYDNLYNSTGVRGWNNPQAENAVQNTILEGVSAAIGKSDVSTMVNQQAVKNAEYANQLALLREKARIEDERARQKALSDANGSGAIVPLRSRREISDNNKKIEEYRRYFQTNADGSISLTPEGWKKMYYDWSDRSGYTSPPEGSYNSTGTSAIALTDFGRFITELNGGNPLLNTSTFHYDRSNGYDMAEGVSPQSIGNLFSQFISNNSEQSYDTYRTTEIDIPLDNSQGEALTEALWRNLPNGAKVSEVDFDGNNREWTDTGNSYTSSDLSGYRITALRPSMYGMTAFLHKDGQDDIRIQLPRSVNVGNLDAVQQGMAEVNAWVQAAYSEYKPQLDSDGYIKYDNNGHVLFTNQRSTEEDRRTYLDLANQVKATTIHNSITVVRPATATTEKH